MRTPLVSILMPAHNTERTIAAAIEGALGQTFDDFELIVIDDGSADGTSRVVEGYSDERLRLVGQEHRGLIGTLNHGLDLVRGRYIARMDSDDVALSERLQRQVAFLDAHSDVGIVGTSLLFTNGAGRAVNARDCPERDWEIRWEMLLENPLIHSTVMFRRELIDRYSLRYDTSFAGAEDYELFSRLLRLTKAANLRERLIRCNLSPESWSSRIKSVQLSNVNKVAFRNIRQQLPNLEVSESDIAELELMLASETADSPKLAGRRVPLARLYFRIFRAFGAHHPEARRIPFRTAAKLGRGLSKGRGEPGWTEAMLQLLALSPGLPWSGILYLIERRTWR